MGQQYFGIGSWDSILGSLVKTSGLSQNPYFKTRWVAPCPSYLSSHLYNLNRLHSRSPVMLPTNQQRPLVDSPFWICFIKGNISRCNGCEGRALSPPDDLVLHHRENKVNWSCDLFQPPLVLQLATWVYYYCGQSFPIKFYASVPLSVFSSCPRDDM